MKVTDFDLKNLAIANRNGAQILSQLQRALQQGDAQLQWMWCGLSGGLLGLLAAYVLGQFVPQIALAGLFFTAAGIVFGLIIQRRAKPDAFASRLEENKLAAQELLVRIRSLPKSAPPDIREELWLMYRELNSAMAPVSRPSVVAASAEAPANEAANPVPAGKMPNSLRNVIRMPAVDARRASAGY